jgi:hypothetical protein
MITAAADGSACLKRGFAASLFSNSARVIEVHTTTVSPARRQRSFARLVGIPPEHGRGVLKQEVVNGDHFVIGGNGLEFPLRYLIDKLCLMMRGHVGSESIVDTSNDIERDDSVIATISTA